MDKNTFLVELSESARTDFGKVDFGEQSDPQKVFSAIWELESQVNNGGFEQFFRYNDWEVISYVPLALANIGAKSCAEIVTKAVAVIAPLGPSGVAPADALDALSEGEELQLEELDEEFFSYPDDLTELLFTHVSEHPAEFGPIVGK